MSAIRWVMVAIFSAASMSAQSARAFTIQVDSTNAPILAWESSQLTFDLNYEACLTLGVSAAELDATIDAALEVWNSTPSTSLKLSRGQQVSTTVTQFQTQTSASNPLIICDPNLGGSLSDDPANPIETNNIPAVTQILKVDGERRIALAMVYLNAQASKVANVKNVLGSPNLLPVVLAHEIGHALGLGHSADINALMYFDATAKTTLSLAQDDMDGISYLYPRHELRNSKLFGCASIALSGGPGRSGANFTRSGHSSSEGSSEGDSALAIQFLGLMLVCGAIVLGFKMQIRAVPHINRLIL